MLVSLKTDMSATPGIATLRTSSAILNSNPPSYPRLKHSTMLRIVQTRQALRNETPNPSFKRTASPPLKSNVGRHKERVSESHASRHCSKAVKASNPVRVCIG